MCRCCSGLNKNLRTCTAKVTRFCFLNLPKFLKISQNIPKFLKNIFYLLPRLLPYRLVPAPLKMESAQGSNFWRISQSPASKSSSWSLNWSSVSSKWLSWLSALKVSPWSSTWSTAIVATINMSCRRYRHCSVFIHLHDKKTRDTPVATIQTSYLIRYDNIWCNINMLHVITNMQKMK